MMAGIVRWYLAASSAHHCLRIVAGTRLGTTANAFLLGPSSANCHPERPALPFAGTSTLLRRTGRLPPRASGRGGDIISSSESMWDPETQTYKDGIVPSHHSAMEIDELLETNDGKLKIFGYGSLCWNPGSDGVLSLASIEEDELDHDLEEAAKSGAGGTSRPRRRVTTAPGRAIGYQRCWSQRSADHRGTPEFNGIVCTLLSDEEVRTLHAHTDKSSSNDSSPLEGDAEKGRPPPSMTEGLIYTVDVDLVDDCLAELDFREKGGYARDVIDVVEDDTGRTVKALLYRGTPDNPAFWKRALLDPPYAAAIMSVAIGPSGPNDAYLLHLHDFLTHSAQHSKAAAMALEDHSGDFRTGELANMVNLLKDDYRPYFLFGTGSNERGQLLLGSADDAAMKVDEVDELTEMLLVVPRRGKSIGDDSYGEVQSSPDDREHEPKSLHAGGGHSAMLTNNGELYLWGWNDASQLGRRSAPSAPSKPSEGETYSSSLNPVRPLSDIKVEAVDLGHTHTLVIEKATGRVFAFGENGRGQVTGEPDGNDSTSADSSHVPRTPVSLLGERFVAVAAGLFHSAAVTEGGELVTWGCGKFGQCLRPSKDESQTTKNDDGAVDTVGRWTPADGSKLVQVACGRRHTVALDGRGRVWTMGDNKYGQLGRSVDDDDGAGNDAAEPRPVDGPLGREGSGCFAVRSGWSHVLALSRSDGGGSVTMYGWGRNDKGQLGVTSSGQSCHVPLPQVLEPPIDGGAMPIESACCGSESSHVLDADGNIHSTGWNEHGNLGIGQKLEVGGDHQCYTWTIASGVGVVAPPSPGSRKVHKKLFASGGAHLIVGTTS